MTMIAGWRCRDGIVIHADSQETDPAGYRVAVQKINPERMGRFDVVIAGSGIGELIDSFVQRISDRMQNESAVALADFKKIFEHELRDFTTSEAAAYPGSKRSKHLTFVAGASSTDTGECELWTTKAGRLRPVPAYELIGWSTSLYEHIAGRFYTPAMPMSQAVLTGVYLLSIAEETCNYIKGPFSVATITPSGICMANQSYITDMTRRLREFSGLVDKIFMACSDTSVYLSVLAKQLTDFSERATLLHKAYLVAVLRDMIGRGLNTVNDPYPRIPPGFTLSLLAGDMDDVIDSSEKDEMMRHRCPANAQVKAGK
jgi:hypothetical protein